jgi:hypothetical protein
MDLAQWQGNPARRALKSASGRKADTRQVSDVSLDRSLRDLAGGRDDLMLLLARDTRARLGRIGAGGTRDHIGRQQDF